MSRARIEMLAPPLVAMLATVLFTARVPTGSLLGWDTYPEVLTSRITSVEDIETDERARRRLFRSCRTA